MAEQISKTRLQAERLEHQWTQAEAAEHIEVDVKTFSRWERGIQVASPLMKQKLSALFQATVDDSWFRPELSREPSTPLWHVPYERNPYFTDDDQRVAHLRALLTGGEEKVISQVAISGLGGMGKTQLALEYAHCYRTFYQAILWVRAGSQEELLEDFMQIAHQLQIAEAKPREEKPPHLVNRICSWLQGHNEWLLVLDNVEEDLDNEDISIARLLSTFKSGHVLLTTRAQSVANLVQNFVLDNISPEEGAEFLLRRSGLLLANSLQSREDALDLARLLNGLPLALEQAAAYIQETRCGLAGYKQVYEVSRKDILQTKITYKRLYTDYSESVATTWLISLLSLHGRKTSIRRRKNSIDKLWQYIDACPVPIIQAFTHSSRFV